MTEGEILCRACAAAAADKKAEDIVVLDLRGISTFTDYFVICSATSEPQLKAISGSIREQIREQFGFPPSTRMVLVRVRGEDESRVSAEIERFAAALRPRLGEDVEMVNPLPRGIPRRRGEYHYQLLLITRRMPTLTRLLKQSVGDFRLDKGLRLTIDVDPLSVL